MLYHIKKQTSNRSFTGMVTINVIKAVDTVDHYDENKKKYGKVKWFESYLTGRKQLVSSSKTKSE